MGGVGEMTLEEFRAMPPGTVVARAMRVNLNFVEMIVDTDEYREGVTYRFKDRKGGRCDFFFPRGEPTAYPLEEIEKMEAHYP